MVAQLLYTETVGGSNPSSPTSLRSERSGERRLPRRSKAKAGFILVRNDLNAIIVSSTTTCRIFQIWFRAEKPTRLNPETDIEPLMSANLH